MDFASHQWLVDEWLSPESLAGLLPALKIAFWSLLFLFILAVLRRSFRPGHHKTNTRAFRIFFAVVAALFIALLAYQATWQLAGYSRPEFVKFMKRYNRRPDNPATRIARGDITDARGLVLAQSDPDVPGRRLYPGGAAFSHIIGYEHELYGLAGVEAAENGALTGQLKNIGDEWERVGKNILKREEIEGADIRLTLVADLQREAYRQFNGRRGAAVFIDPSNGAILALCSSPGFDPAKLTPDLFRKRDPESRLLNRAMQGLYPAGSTMKLIVAAAALERGINPVIDCPADGYRAGTGNKPIRDHEYYEYQREGRAWPGHGRLTMREALAKSSNIYFARLGVQVGGEALHATAVRCGLTRSWVLLDGSSSRLASSSGRFPPLTNRDIAKTAQVSIGQGDMLVTPLHMALVTGAIGRNGVMWKPRLDAGEPPAPLETIFPAGICKSLAGMMRDSVAHGTGTGADVPGLMVAGKTGTAQNPHGDDHGWFVGFAPTANPRIAFAVIVENAGYGSRTAVPVVAGVLKKAQEIGWFKSSSATADGGTP